MKLPRFLLDSGLFSPCVTVITNRKQPKALSSNNHVRTKHFSSCKQLFGNVRGFFFLSNEFYLPINNLSFIVFGVCSLNFTYNAVKTQQFIRQIVVILLLKYVKTRVKPYLAQNRLPFKLIYQNIWPFSSYLKY